MPHAESDMSSPVTNGDKPHSHFLSHLKSYPVVNDSVETFLSNPYGAKSLDIAETAYTKLGKPVMPYLRTPYSYAAPYVAKADSLADKGLEQVDTRFPIVREDTITIKDTVVNYAFFPFRVAGEGRTYVMNTYEDQYNRTASRNNRGNGLSTSFLAIISTQLKIAADSVNLLADWFGPKSEEAKQKSNSLLNSLYNKASAYGEQAKQKADEANEKKETYAEKAQEKSGY
ncbi:hypothetical protein VTO58DRAFT_102685 [Aureobasidium pullulans]|nr:hypothetical protein JADG_003530 [Aureobasidium pullulans]